VEQQLALLLRAGYRLVALETFEEERGLRLLARAAKRAERSLYAWTVASGLKEWTVASGLAECGDGAGSLAAGLEALAGIEEPAVFAMLDATAGEPDAIGIRRLRDALPRLTQRHQSLVVIAPVVDVPAALEREVGRLSLPLPTAAELRNLFERVVAGARGEVAAEPLEQCVRAALGLTGAEAVRVFRKAWLTAGALDDAAVGSIVREKQRALRRTPALSYHEAPDDLAQVGGLGELKRWLRARRRAFGEDARRFGPPAPRGILLLGVQGCGKSLCAKAVAREWRFPLLRLDLGTALGGGSSPELAMREATAVAESLAPVVLWIDEIEKGFAATGRDPRASRVFGTFLTWLAEKRAPVFVAATANDVAALPPELLRRGRFDELFFVDLPTEAERAEILAIHLAKRGRDPKQLPLQELAAQAHHHSGAELEQVVAAGLYSAFDAGRELSEADLADAVQETVPLYETYEERIKELRNWARTRARAATLDPKLVDLFGH